MSESRSHIDLVATVVNYVKKLVLPDFHAIIQYDSPDSPRPSKVIGNFIPDVYFWNKDLLIIGEAKTLKDFDKRHSLDQYRAYMQECKNFWGESILVIAVPWPLVITAKNHFRRLKKEFVTDVSIFVLNELGEVFKV